MITAGVFQPDPLNWLFGNGIGTNIGASIIWGFAAGMLGVLVARKLKTGWARLHERLDQLHAEHKASRELHEEIHHLLYTGDPHPRVEARMAAGEKPTPERKPV